MRFSTIFIVLLALNLSSTAQTPELSFESFQTGFSSPTTITHAGDDRIFVLEQDGLVKIIENGDVSTFMNIKSIVSSPADDIDTYADELGLLGLAFDPDFENNGYFYLNYTNNDLNTIVSRFSVNPDDSDQGDDNSEEVIIEIEQPYSNHNGGCIAFGPDGYLYIGMGDGGNGGDPQGFGQNMTSLLGKVLRLDVSTLPYSVPSTNPFVGNDDYSPEIWASGLRNPWRFSFDTETGDLWIADVGQNAWEEVDFQSANSQGGENYGWNCFEGFEPFQDNVCTDEVTEPVHTYENNGYPNDCSITGGFVYRGTTYPNFNGHYIFGDYCTGKIFTLSDQGNASLDLSTQENTDIFISCFGEDSNGELYLADRNTGEIFSVVDNSSIEEVDYYDGPESVDYDSVSNRYFISNSNNGEILEMDCQGNLSVFISNVGNGPHGLEVVGNEIFACSGSRLKAYNLTSGSETIDRNLGATFANGITHNGNNVYITDFSDPKIYHYDIEDDNLSILIDNLSFTPNGIFYDDIENRMLVLSFQENASIYELNMADTTIAIIKETNLGYLDGIAMDNNGDFYVSAWSNNAIHKFNSDFSGNPTNILSGMNQPADIYFNRDLNVLAVPNSGNNTVVFEGFGINTSYNCVDYQCQELSDQSGEFNTMECCQEYCQAPANIVENANLKNIFPNPVFSGETLNFHTIAQEIELYDLKGRLLMDIKNNKQSSINLPNLQSGIYILNYDNNTTKLIVE
jgi:glucose/arabinose dehydrogenase